MKQTVTGHLCLKVLLRSTLAEHAAGGCVGCVHSDFQVHSPFANANRS